MLALAHHPADRHGRRRRRLQPRQFGPHRHAGRPRFDRPDAVEGRPEPHTAPAGREGHRLFQRPVQPAGGRPTSRSRQQFSSPQQGSFTLTVSGSATISTMFWRLIGQQQVNITASGEVVWGIKKLNLALALDNTGSMASSNKMTELKKAAHNLLDYAEEGREDAGRHQDLDRAVRGRRQCRHRQRQRDLDRLERLGRQERHLQQVLVPIARAAARRQQRDLDARQTTAPGTAA